MCLFFLSSWYRWVSELMFSNYASTKILFIYFKFLFVKPNLTRGDVKGNCPGQIFNGIELSRRLSIIKLN